MPIFTAPKQIERAVQTPLGCLLALPALILIAIMWLVVIPLSIPLHFAAKLFNGRGFTTYREEPDTGLFGQPTTKTVMSYDVPAWAVGVLLLGFGALVAIL